MIHLTENIIAVELPEGAYKIEVIKNYIGDWVIRYFCPSFSHKKLNISNKVNVELLGVISNGEIDRDLGRKAFIESGYHIDYLLAGSGLDLTKCIAIIKTK